MMSSNSEKRCKAIVQQGPRKGMQCEKELPESGYCVYHQRNKEYDTLIAEGKNLCNGFFRGCNNQLTEKDGTFKFCEVCRLKKSGKQFPCEYKTCTAKIYNKENKYCEKHIRQHLYDHEKVANIQYCDISRGCFNILTDDIKCKECRKKEKQIVENQITLLRNKYSIILEPIKEKDKLFEKQESIVSDIKEVWRSVQRNAMTRKLLFTLSQSDVEKLVIQPCYYCGFYSEHKFVGIDRIDNNKGYILDNCVSCCKMCNMMKNTNHPIAFLDKVKIICNYKMMRHPITTQSQVIWKNYLSSGQGHTFKEYIYHSEKVRNIKFLLSKAEYDELIKGECYLCGIHPMEGHRNGIDRVDNNGDYSIDNCKTCCGHCNRMKRDYSYEDFMSKCIQINTHVCDRKIFKNVLNIEKLKNEYYTAADIEKFLKDGYLTRFLEWCEEKKKSVEFTTAITHIASTLEPNMLDQISKELENERRRKYNTPLPDKKHVQSSTVYSWIISNKDDMFLEWYSSQYEKTSLFDERYKKLKELIHSMSKEDGIKACKKLMYDEKCRRNSQKIRDEKKRDITTYSSEKVGPEATPTPTNIFVSQLTPQAARKSTLPLPIVRPTPIRLAESQPCQNGRSSATPKQWKTRDIYTYITNNDERTYLEYLKESNPIDKIEDFEIKWSNLLSAVKDKTFSQSEAAIKEFILWLRNIRHNELCAATSAKRVLEKDERQHYRADGILILFRTNDTNEIAKFKKYTEEYAGDDPSDPKWSKRWNTFVENLQKTESNEGKKKLVSTFLAAQRKKKYDRSK